ncbi:MAG TPA: hypothetical protein VH092_07325 [Urbifossiella sp.]|nr:hypothetical protein [Urbifossiella sp.]
MNWAVAFAPGIEREALELWAVSPDPAATRAALGEIKTRLGADPHTAGHHLSEGLWKIAAPPLTAYYTIDTVRQSVEITDIAAAP